LGHVFHDPALLTRALTHSSANSAESNERLEFLGDRVLGLIAAEKLHALYPADAEGALALKFNALARQDACAQAADAAVLAGTCEAVIAALYLDGGMEAARQFVERYWTDAFTTLDRDMRDPKTALQEWAQGRKEFPGAPAYRIARREGPDHRPRFWVEVSVAGHDPIIGEGGSKREAEQAAAKTMLARLGLT
jgi:ribonuclease-3